MTTLPSAPMDSELLTEVQELVQVGMWMWDVPSNTVRWSDELFRLFGLEPQSIELDLETFLQRVHPGDVDRIASTIQSALGTRSGFEFDHRIVLPDGASRVLHGRGFVRCDAIGAVTRMVGTSMDVTESARGQEAL